jgi:predicted alpha/beta superfamily hydrolase
MTQPVVIPGTESHIVHSDLMDFDFQIYVQPPPVEIDVPLPVVYSTDANLGFGFAANMTTMLLMGGEIPPVLTIGIGYPVGLDLEYVTNRRMYDFSPTSDAFQLGQLSESALTEGAVKGGGAPLFARFMQEELWAWVSERYKVTDDRTYVGDSMGGLFGIYTLFNHPGFFGRYVIGSPWICWDHPLCFDYEAAYAESHDDLEAVVFLSAGGAEHVISPAFDPHTTEIFNRADTEAHTVKMGEILAGRSYPSLRLKTLIFPEETHFTVPYALTAHGMRYVFQAA